MKIIVKIVSRETEVFFMMLFYGCDYLTRPGKDFFASILDFKAFIWQCY